MKQWLLKDTLDQMDLIDIFRTFHIKAAECISSAYGIFSRIDHKLCHKTSLDKFKKTEIISSSLITEINYKKKTKKHTNTCWRNYILLNNK